MINTVLVVGKSSFKNKSGKTSYCLHLVDHTENNFDIEGYMVCRAFTSEKHYNKLEVNKGYEGYLSYENGFYKFYLPKETVK